MERQSTTRCSLHALTAIAAVALLGVTLGSIDEAAAQDGPGVIYSYEMVQLGNTAQWVLVPRTLKGNLSGDLETDARAAFTALRNAKPPTYGGTNVQVDPAQLKKGAITIEIDAGVKDYALIIQAEAVHTMATLGLSQVKFTGAVSETMTIDDVPFTAFAPTLPLWRALPPATLVGALVRMPDGSVMSIDTFQSKLKDQDAAAVRAVFKALDEAAPLAQAGIIAALPGLKLEDWQEHVVKRLKDDAPDVRKAAVTALKGTKDGDILEALVAVVDKDADAGVQAAAADALAASGNKKYGAYGVYYALRSEDTAVALGAIDEIVAQKIDTASEELVRALEHPQQTVGAAAAAALGKLGKDRELTSAIANDAVAVDVRQEAAVALTTLSDKDAAFAGRRWLAVNARPDLALDAVDGLKNSKDPEPFDALAAALDSPHRDVRIAAAAALGGLKEDDSLKPLAAAAARHVDERIEIEDAIVALLESSQSLSDLEDRTKKERDSILKRATYRALGRKAVAANRMASVRDKLVAGLDDGDDQARGGALLGLAEDPTEENMALISARAGEPGDQVRQDVALALGRFEAGKATDVLLKLAKDSSADVAIAAVRSFGQRAEATVVRDLVKLGKDDARVRISLIRNLPLLANNDTRADVVAYISNLLFDADRSVKLAAIDALGRVSDDQSISSLAMLVQDPDKEIQFATFSALAVSKHADAVSLLGKGLEVDDTEVRKAALRSLAALGTADARASIKATADADADAEVKALAQQLLAQMN